jgi:hypothetical protein
VLRYRISAFFPVIFPQRLLNMDKGYHGKGSSGKPGGVSSRAKAFTFHRRKKEEF